MTNNSYSLYIASKNPVKINAVNQGFGLVFPKKDFNIIPCQTPSGVSDQPMSNQETKQGAINRLQYIEEHYPGGAFWVAIEGGIEKIDGELLANAWIFVKSGATIGKSRSASFVIPEPLAKLVLAGHELGVADDMYFNRTDSKQQDGTIGILTNQLIDRTAFYVHALILALIPFKGLSFDSPLK